MTIKGRDLLVFRFEVCFLKGTPWSRTEGRPWPVCLLGFPERHIFSHEKLLVFRQRGEEKFYSGSLSKTGIFEFFFAKVEERHSVKKLHCTQRNL